MSAFYDLASLVVVPSGYKSGKIYAQKPQTTDGQLAFTRASSATRVASNGLIEKVRTNLSLYSEQFDNAYWGKSNITITANNTTDPFGGSAADKALCAAGTVSPNIFSSAVNCVSGVEYTASYYAKQGTSKYAKIRFSSTAFASSTNSPIFDLNAGTVVSGTGTITSVGNGWYRISATQVAEASASGIFTVDIPSSTGVWPNGTFAGTEFIYIFGYQFEENVSVSPYIATTSAAVSVGPVSGLPRLDYLNSTCPRLLLEPQRTNLALNSEQFNNATWSKYQSTITANAVTSPDGYVNADKFLDSTANDGHALYAAFTISGDTTFSIFVKSAEYTRFAAENFSDGGSVIFNLSTATVVSTSANYKNAKVENYGNGWYRLSATTNGTSGSKAIGWSLVNNSGNIVFVGTGTNGVYVYGAQAEAGAYATSYIPTLGTSVTRVADAASKTGISSLIGQTEGTLFAEFIAVKNSAFSDIASLGSNGSNLVELQYNGSTNILSGIYYAGSALATINSLSALTIGQTYKVAFAYKTNDFVMYLNGVQQGVDTSGTIVAGMAEVSLNGYGGGINNNENALIKQALIFKTRLTNSQLAELTA